MTPELTTATQPRGTWAQLWACVYKIDDMNQGQADTTRALSKKGVRINWQARFRLERGMTIKARVLLKKYVLKILLAEVKKNKAKIDAAHKRASEAVVDNAAAFERQMDLLIRDYAVQSYQLGAQDIEKEIVGAARKAGVDVAFSVRNRPAEDFIAKRINSFAAKQADLITRTVSKTALKVVRTGIREGQSIREIQEAMKAKAGVALGRGEVIARTTVVKANNLGRTDQAEKVGIKQMDLVGCDDECEECQAVISANPHNIDDVAAIEIGLHPNHTGSWVPVITPEMLELGAT